MMSKEGQTWYLIKENGRWAESNGEIANFVFTPTQEAVIKEIVKEVIAADH